MKSFKQYLNEMKRPRWELPPEPGTAPIPKDHVRLYHQTQSDAHLDSIKRNGIQFKHAKGYEGPKAIYADEKGFYGKPGDKPTAEFSVHKDRWHKPFVQGDVEPKSIVSTHKKWHQTARYIEDDPRLKKAVLAGEHDDLMKKDQPDDKYRKAIRFIKRKYAAKEKTD